jgi:carboxyl-terminal processing protease
MVFAKVARPLVLSIGAVVSMWTATTVVTAPAWGQEQPAVSAPLTVNDLSQQVWAGAHGGKGEQALSLIGAVPSDTANAVLAKLREANTSFESNIKKREAARAAKLASVTTDLDKALAEPAGYPSYSKALKSAVEMYMLSAAADKPAVLKDARVAKLIEDAAALAKKAESDGDWLAASEVFFRLHALLEEEGTYKDDSDRLNDRLAMIRLYVPERFYELRKAHADGQAAEDKIPPYNALGEDYRQKLAGIDEPMVLRALNTAADKQVDRVPMTSILTGGIGAIRTMLTTPDLERVFPGISDTDARTKLLKFLDEHEQSINTPKADPGRLAMISLVENLLDKNRETVKLPDEALLHEFGNGAMSKLDEFSAIIWPDEKARFDRMTQGEFKGVGIQIQLDKESQAIKVVTPLEGTPAQRAGVHAGDIITKIDGKSAIGLSLNQAVDLITGPDGTQVGLTMQREGKDIDFTLQRAVIPLVTVKGWKRLGAKEDQWDWYIDPENKIGYVRLLQFTEKTSHDLDVAIRQMQQTGLNGLVLDLRFNPGGLLTQAVAVANTFIDKGLIVSTKGTMPSDRQSARPENVLLQNVPLAVLINEGSASASEIVSGAIRHYADANQLKAVIIGARSFGKGSVQNVWPLNNEQTALLKLTTQYYHLPDGRVLHRRPGAHDWGVNAHLVVDMLPEQIVDALRLRQEADVVAIDETGKVVEGVPTPPDPQKLITDGLDLQLQAALVLLQSQTVAHGQEHVLLDKKVGGGS